MKRLTPTKLKKMMVKSKELKQMVSELSEEQRKKLLDRKEALEETYNNDPVLVERLQTLIDKDKKNKIPKAITMTKGMVLTIKYIGEMTTDQETLEDVETTKEYLSKYENIPDKEKI